MRLGPDQKIETEKLRIQNRDRKLEKKRDRKRDRKKKLRIQSIPTLPEVPEHWTGRAPE